MAQCSSSGQPPYSAGVPAVGVCFGAQAPFFFTFSRGVMILHAAGAAVSAPKPPASNVVMTT